MPKVSVILPCYNAEQFIASSIQSILNQTFSDFELLVIDDGSTDSSASVIKSFSDSRIRYIKNDQNLGLIKTLNRGLKLAVGIYVARMDADDISLPERFEKQVQYLDSHPDISLLGTGIEFFPIEGKAIPIEAPTVIDMLGNNCFYHPTVMFRRKVFLKECLWYEDQYPYAEDYALWTKAVRKLKCRNLKETLLLYRKHENNITKTKHNEMLSTADAIQKELLFYLTKNVEYHEVLLALGLNDRICIKAFNLLLNFIGFLRKIKRKLLSFSKS